MADPKDAPPTSTAAPAYKLKVGYNLAWYNYGFDFGPNPYFYNLQDPSWIDKLGPNLATLKSAGVEVVRWFILQNGFSYGFHPTYTGVKGLIGWDYEVWSFDPPNPPDTRFAKHFEQALQIFKEQKMLFVLL